METVEQKYRRFLADPDEMDRQARSDADIDLDDAYRDCGRQPQLYIEWGQLAAIAETQAESVAEAIELVFAESKERARANLLQQNDKATDDRVKAVATIDPVYQKQLVIKRQVELFAKRLKVIAKGFEQRKDMLIQVSSRQRKEFDHYPSDPDTRTRSNYDETQRERDLEELKNIARRRIAE